MDAEIELTDRPEPNAIRQRVIDERGAADLAFDAATTAQVLATDYGLRDGSLAARVQKISGGWPALVRLAGEQLAATPSDWDEVLRTLAAPGTAIATFLDKHVLATLPRGTIRLMRDIAHVGAVDEDLCRHLGHHRPERIIATLARTGSLVAGERPATLRLVPLVGDVARERWPLPDDERDALFATAGDWFAANGRPREAIDAYRRASVACGRATACAALLRWHGPAWVTSGGGANVIAAARGLPDTERDTEVRLLLGEALLVLGEHEQALAELSAIVTPVDDTLPPGLAWRLGATHCLRGDPHAAVATLARGRIATQPTADEAMILAWDATARWMTGNISASGDLARRALIAADRAGDDRARAAAHVAAAMHAMLAGDRPGNAAHYERALRYAHAAGDVAQAARIHANRSAQMLEEACYQQALTEACRAKSLAEATDCAAILALALCNEAASLHFLGRLDEATLSAQRALTLLQRRGSLKVAYPLIVLGAIHRTRGRHNLALAAYEEAARVATEADNVQAIVPALAGLARVLAGDDPAEAAHHARIAVAAASGPYLTEALLATGWAALGAGDRDSATRGAVEAAAQARRHRDRAGLAEALELRAAAETDVAGARQALREAAETWRLIGAPIQLDRVVAALGALPEAAVAERVTGRLARDRIEAAGVSLPAMTAPTTGCGRAAAPVVSIRSLGRFEVCVGGVAVGMSLWQSRKARDLLRILVARRGRAIARDELVELLWHGGDPERLAHRLSVALSTVRSVLDPDRAADADYFVLADRSGVALEVNRFTIDLEVFLAEAAHGLALRERGNHDEAWAVLADAERCYAGDFMENEPYEDWSVAAREEARATYLRVARALAELSRQANRVDDAVHYLLRVLDKDPYDERGHRELVRTLTAAGRHGEARRAQTRYLAAMSAIGVASA